MVGAGNSDDFSELATLPDVLDDGAEGPPQLARIKLVAIDKKRCFILYYVFIFKIVNIDVNIVVFLGKAQ